MANNQKIEKLITQLRDKNEKRRLSAAQEMAQMGAKAQAAIPALIQRLKSDESKAVVGVAAYALSQIGEPAVPALIELLSEKSIRLKVAKTLRRIGTKEALKASENVQ